jgi:xanthine dehydrogenase accessory factor
VTAWTSIALAHLRAGDPLALVTLLATEGSTPREAGAKMLIWAGGQSGSIGGGNLEHQATAQARQMLTRADNPAIAIQDYPLGPLLAQCCGGRVRLMIERLGPGDATWLAQADRLAAAGRPFEIVTRLNRGPASKRAAPARGASGPPVTLNRDPARARARRPGPGDEIIERLTPAPLLRLFGAGHVGQAIARACSPLPFRLDWLDSRPDVADETGARWLAPEALAAAAAEAADFTLILTHDHALDFALTAAALGGPGEGYLGLIGSRSKRARFARRLREAGLGEAALARLTCPIGLPGLAGKDPAIIAVSVAADLLTRRAGHAPAPFPEVALAGL